MSAPLPAGETLALAFAILERESPRAFEWMSVELRGLRIRCAVAEERFTVYGAERPVVEAGSEPLFQVDVEAGKDAILALIDGETDVLGAIVGRRVKLIADIGLMVRLSRAQRAFAEGAVRAAPMRDLLRRYRG
jgi:hypothetical protein